MVLEGPQAQRGGRGGVWVETYKGGDDFLEGAFEKVSRDYRYCGREGILGDSYKTEVI